MGPGSLRLAFIGGRERAPPPLDPPLKCGFIWVTKRKQACPSHARTVDGMAMSIKCFFFMRVAILNLHKFFCPVSEGNKCTEVFSIRTIKNE